MPRLMMTEAIPPVPYVPSWREQRYLH